MPKRRPFLLEIMVFCPEAGYKFKVNVERSCTPEADALWKLVGRQNLLVRKLTHRRDTLEEIFLKAMGHLSHTPGEDAADGANVTAG